MKSENFPNFFTCCLLVMALGMGQGLQAQQEVPFINGSPVAPEGLKLLPLPEQPLRYDTAEGMDILVQVEVRGLEHPWSLVFLPDGSKLITERNSGRLRVVRNRVLDPEPVSGVPEVVGSNFGGLMDLALHPRFDENNWVYFSFNKRLTQGGSAVAVGRGRWDGSSLQDTADVFVADPGTSAASRIAFGNDGMLYVSLFGITDAAQDPMRHEGKVLRLTPEGAVPGDNPFVGRQGYRPELYTLGHRTITGLAVHPLTGDLWVSEMGPNGGDEINILQAGANYGWPTVSLGRSYPGPWQSNTFQREGMIDPVLYWMPSISVSGLAFYTGTELSRWTGDVFVGGLRYAEVPGTGRLQRILINLDMEELRREDLLLDLRQRIRDVRQGPDGFLYLLTDEADGALLRIELAP
jgi:aldose sugar dehydrogenase